MTTSTPLTPATLEEREFSLLVGGALRPAESASTADSVDPSTGRVVARFPVATDADVAEAVSAAQAAQPAWRDMGLSGRRECFEALAERVAAHADQLAMIDAIDGGNPLSATTADVRSALARIRDWPGLALSVAGRTYPASAHNLHYTVNEPYGVVGRIVPFNHPAAFAIGKVLAPLVAGNTVVLKPAEQTPLSALVFGELASDVFPPGVLNILSGGPATGDALVRHPDVKRIAFTGSVATAMKLSQSAAEVGIKHLSLELGGKNALIAFPDSDLDQVVQGVVDGMNFTLSQGQSCGSTSRAFIHADLYDPFLEALQERLSRIKIGRAYDAGVQMGPLVSAAQYERVLSYVRAGEAEGARLVCGGTRPAGLDQGYFLEPTVFADVAMSMRIAREEIFGPVLSVFRWTDYDDVIAQANDLDLGLTASIWTSDLTLAHRTAALLDAGYVWINGTRTHYWGMPFGGFKNSGLGREEAIEELYSYFETKTVNTILGTPRIVRPSRDGRAPQEGAGG